jgi:hypothetical protein
MNLTFRTFLTKFKAEIRPMRHLRLLQMNSSVKSVSKLFRKKSDCLLTCTYILELNRLNALPKTVVKPFLKGRIWKFTWWSTRMRGLLYAQTAVKVSEPKVICRTTTVVTQEQSKEHLRYQLTFMQAFWMRFVWGLLLSLERPQTAQTQVCWSNSGRLRVEWDRVR